MNPISWQIFGIEGKQEKNDVEQLMDQLFSNENPSIFEALGLVGINPHSMNANELDLILMLSWHPDDPSYFDKYPNGIRSYNINTHEESELTSDNRIKLLSVISSIEIKAHSPNKVIIRGDDLYVKYYDKEQCVTSKLIGQAQTARNFLGKNFLNNSPTIQGFIYLPNVKKGDFLSIKNRNIWNSLIFSDTTNNEFLINVLKKYGVITFNENLFFCGNRTNNTLDNPAIKHKIEKYYRQLIPTKLEQDKMEIISKKIIDEQNKQWSGAIDKKMIAFTGKAGTGKTIRLLRTAKDLTERYVNVLFLTFNRALARDLDRLMQLQKINKATSIQVLTIDQFLYQLAESIGLGIEDNDNSNEYFSMIRELLQEEVKNESSLKKMKEVDKYISYIAIDEAQDWFVSEREIILGLFKPTQIFIAAGLDQCLRAPQLANWKIDVTEKGFEIIEARYDVALRQATNLTKFNNDFSTEIGLSWEVKPNRESRGGDIYLFDYIDDKVFNIFLEEYIRNNKSNEYALIDYLILMSAQRKARESKKLKKIFTFIKTRKYEVWDALSERDRDIPPTRNQLRLVSHESCRGLESWATLILDIDFWIEFALRKEHERNENLEFDIYNLPIWFLIPFTRAKSRILIEIPKDETIKNALLRLKEKNPEFIHRIN